LGEDHLNISYLEELPAQCPPTSSIDQPIEEAYRLIPTGSAGGAHFASKTKMGIPMIAGGDACSWSACSIFTKVKPLLSLKRLKAENPYLAKLQIPEGTGRHILNSGRGHADFWTYADHCLSACVISVEDTRNA
jgi:hypothetical protein